MVLHLVRVLFLLVVLGISISLGFQAARDMRLTFTYAAGTILAPVVLAFLLVLVDMLWHRKRLQVLSGLFFGVLAGLVIAYGLTIVVDRVVEVSSSRASWASRRCSCASASCSRRRTISAS